MEKLQERIKELLFETLSRQEQLILIYLEANINQLPKMTLAQVADNNFCSPTSVTRLIKKLGYNNFRELQMSIVLQLEVNKPPIVDKKISPSFITGIKEAKCLYIYGKGASHISAMYIFRKLIKLGYDVSLIDEQDLLYSLQEKTVLCVSNSGETTSVNKLMSNIKEWGDCTILAITSANSSLCTIADQSITFNKSYDYDRDDQKHALELIARLTNQL